VEASGGSHADGNTFRIAVIHTCILATQDELQESTDPGIFLTNLSEAHFRDWAAGRKLEINSERSLPGGRIPGPRSPYAYP
jgi:hypothetical protein